MNGTPHEMVLESQLLGVAILIESLLEVSASGRI